MKWEYFEEAVEGHVTVEHLNMRGEDAWELCATTTIGTGVRLIYKRQKGVFEGERPS